MSAPLINVIPLAVKQVVRHKIRSFLTVLGIAAGMFLFAVHREHAAVGPCRDGNQCGGCYARCVS